MGKEQAVHEENLNQMKQRIAIQQFQLDSVKKETSSLIK